MVSQQPGGTTGDRTPNRTRLIAIVVAAVFAVVIIVAVIVGANRGPTTPAGQGTDVPGSSASADPGTGSGTGTTTPDPGQSGSATASADPNAPVEQSPVPINSPAAPLPGLTVTITGLAAIDGKASGIGEVGGPSLQFTVNAANSTDADISLATTVVTVTYGTDSTPSDQLPSASTPLPGDVAAGATATGSYVFVVPVDQRANVRISVDYQVGTPIVVFEGAAPQS